MGGLRSGSFPGSGLPGLGFDGSGYAGFGFDGSGLSPGLGFGLSPESVIVSPFGAKHGLSRGEFAIR